MSDPRPSEPEEPAPRLEDAPPARPALGLASAYAAIAVIALALLVAACVLVVSRSKQRIEKCRNNVQQIALAAIQYSDDKRFFPHLHKMTELDGDYRTNEGPRALRLLHFFNYCDEPATYLCPATPDSIAPIGTRFLQVVGERPFDAPCPTLADAHDLSYGWTRRAYTTRSLSSSVLVGDRSSVYHQGSRVIAHLDAHSEVIKPDAPESKLLGAVSEPGALFLGVFPDDMPSPSPPRTGIGREEALMGSSCVLLALSSLGAFVVSRRRRSQPKEA